MAEDTDTGDKASDDLENIEPANTAETNSIVTEHGLPGYNPETENMEVHKHPHHVMHKKKWQEYVLEFFMLFLAVFLGFLAENWREHITEHEKEKQYMQSLAADISADTLEINKSISTASTALRYEDSVRFYIYTNHPVDFLPVHFLDIDLNALLDLK